MNYDLLSLSAESYLRIHEWLAFMLAGMCFVWILVFAFPPHNSARQRDWKQRLLLALDAAVVLVGAPLMTAVMKGDTERMRAALEGVQMFITPATTLVITRQIRRRPIKAKIVIGHLLPFVIILCVLCINPHTEIRPYILGASAVYAASFWIWNCFAAKRYYTYLKEEYSSVAHYTLQWILMSLLLIAIITVFWLYAYISKTLAAQCIFFFTVCVCWNMFFLVGRRLLGIRERSNKFATLNDEEKMHIIRAIGHEKKEDINISGEEFERRLKEVCEDRELYTQQSITRQYLCQEMGISQIEFAQLLKETRGLTFYDYINGLRIKKAKELLRGQETPIEEIVTIVGYRFTETFYSVFLDMVGVSPNKYRAGRKGKEKKEEQQKEAEV